jgi:transitional endoplasmic reticulum ATPase
MSFVTTRNVGEVWSETSNWFTTFAAVSAADFAEALEDSRATVTAEMEEEYQRMKGELKKRAMEVSPIGFIAPGMLEPTRERKHG